LQSAIKDKFDHAATLIESSGGAFEVRVDGKLIFSKLKTFRFPDNDEIFDAISSLQSV
jgi:selT/selW/selH-like putative selenoprotein